MSVKLRLQRKGRKKRPFYHIVAADHRAPRDGRFIEKLGTYNPMTSPATIELDGDRAFHWLMNGAQPTDTVRSILRFRGILFKKHLHIGVLKGKLTEEQAAAKLSAWLEEKEAKIAKRIEKVKADKAAFNKKMAGVAPPKEEEAPKPEAPAAETPAAEAPAAETADAKKEEE